MNMEVSITFKICDYKEEDCCFPEYAQGKLANLTNDDLVAYMYEVVEDAIIDNRMYYNVEDAQGGIENVVELAKRILFNPDYNYIRSDFYRFIRLMTLLTVQIA